MVLVSSISNFFTNKTSLANKWMSFSSSNLALRISQDPSKRSNNYNSIFWEKLDKIYETAAIQGRFSSVACQKINKREKINILVVSLPLTDTDLSRQTPYLSALDFRILDFRVYFKLGKKSSSKPTWFFLSLNLISTACVACKNQFRNQIDFSVF